MKNYVIFAIDNDNDLHTVSKFLRHVDTQRALGNIKGTLKPCIGSYKGQMENSYIMRLDDFDLVVSGSGYVDNQESILLVEEGHRGVLYGTLLFSSISMKDQPLGILRAVPPERAMTHDGWTYRPDLDTYYVVV